MFIKLGIIAGVIILGGMIFSTEVYNLFPTTATAVDSFKNDVTNLGVKATDSVEKRIDESMDTIVNKTGNVINNEIREASDKLSTEISEVKESSQEIINKEIYDFDLVGTIQNIFTIY